MPNLIPFLRPEGKRLPKASHKYRYDKGVWKLGWVIGQNPFKPEELVFLDLEGEIEAVDYRIVEAINKSSSIYISDPAQVSRYKDLIKTLTHLTPATRAPAGEDQNSPPYHPGIGAGMLNSLIDLGKNLEPTTK